MSEVSPTTENDTQGPSPASRAASAAKGFVAKQAKKKALWWVLGLVGAPTLAVIASVVLVGVVLMAVLSGGKTTTGGASGATTQATVSAVGKATIPPVWLPVLMSAATGNGVCTMPWPILAGIASVETDFGQSTLPGVHSGANSAGAEGLMQFEPSTFAGYDTPVPPGGASPPSPYNLPDAVYAAARMLCSNGVDSNPSGAIFSYNHASWYVNKVEARAAAFANAVISTVSSVHGYSNPLRGITALTPERVDQGVDYSGSGPIYAMGNGVVLNTVNSGWPGGTFISYRLTSGSAAGLIVYAAESIFPSVSVGQSVTASTVLGTMYGGIETGWAAPPGTGLTMARTYHQFSGANSTAFGANFSALLTSLGAPGGIMQNTPATGSLPSGWAG